LTVKVAVLVVPLYDPEMVTGVEVPTANVVTVKVTELAPAGTSTVAGTVAANVLLLESATRVPPVGAFTVSFTVPVEVAGAFTLVGLKLTADREVFVLGVTVRFADLVKFRVAEIATTVEELTGNVVIVNVAEVAPAATVTLAGTVAAAVLLLDRVTTAPPVGAAPLRVTVPVEVLPVVTLIGFNDTEESEMSAVAVKAVRDALPLLTVTDALTGAKENPVRVGVTV
jgi:hypothetical protein